MVFAPLIRYFDDKRRKAKLLNPEAKDFKVRRKRAGKHQLWIVQHRDFPLISGLFNSREEAESMIPLMVLELRIASPKNDEKERERLIGKYIEALEAFPRQALPASIINDVSYRKHNERIPYHSCGLIRLGEESKLEFIRIPR